MCRELTARAASKTRTDHMNCFSSIVRSLLCSRGLSPLPGHAVGLVILDNLETERTFTLPLLAHFWRGGGKSAAVVSALLVFFSWPSLSHALTVTENFSTNPTNRSWSVYGDTNLFRWNTTNQTLAATWDSSKTNTYFQHSLGTILTKSDNFSLSFDLRLDDLAIGVSAGKPYSFELCIGLQNSISATKSNFFRGNSALCPNLAEFSYFPDSGYGATVWPTFTSTNSAFNYSGASDYTLVDLPFGTWMHIAMNYTATNKTLTTAITTNGVSIGTLKSLKVSTNFTDFRVDTFAVKSYSDAGQNPNDSGSLLAHGAIDNLSITVPDSPVQNLRTIVTNAHWTAEFTSATNWSYALERTTNLSSWSETSVKTNGTGSTILLQDTNIFPGTAAFYRIKANRQ